MIMEGCHSRESWNLLNSHTIRGSHITAIPSCLSTPSDRHSHTYTTTSISNSPPHFPKNILC